MPNMLLTIALSRHGGELPLGRWLYTIVTNRHNYAESRHGKYEPQIKCWWISRSVHQTLTIHRCFAILQS